MISSSTNHPPSFVPIDVGMIPKQAVKQDHSVIGLTNKINNITGKMCDTLETLHTACVIAGRAVKQAPRVFTAVAAASSGLSQIYGGDTLKGVAFLGIGLSEIYKCLSPQQITDINRELNNADAELRRICELSKEGKESVKNIQQHIQNIENHLIIHNNKLKEIETIVSEGSAELAAQKKNILLKHAESKKLFECSLAFFKDSLEGIQKANKSYDMMTMIITKHGQKLQDPSNQSGVFQQLAQFIEEVQFIAKNAKNGSEYAQTNILKGLDTYMQADVKKQEAETESLKIIQKAQEKLKLIEELAKNKIDHENLLKEVGEEARALEQNYESIEHHLAYAEEHVKNAQNIASGYFSGTTVLIGSTFATMGAIATAPVSGVVVGMTIGLGVGRLLEHNSNQTSPFKAVEVSDSSNKFSSPVSFEFDKKSSGFWGRLRGRESKTKGSVTVRAGNENLTFGFDLNQGGKIATADIHNLSRRLVDKLKHGKITPAECRAIITSLDTISVDRGGIGLIKGFIPKKQFFELDRLCTSLENKMKKQEVLKKIEISTRENQIKLSKFGTSK